MMKASRGHLLTICALSLLLVAIPLLVRADEDRAYISGSFSQYVEVNTSYVGENVLYLVVCFGQDAVNWSMDVDGPLLRGSLRYSENVSVWAGSSRDAPLWLNSSAPPGRYTFSARLRYNASDGTPVDEGFNLTVHHVRALELRRMSIVHGSPPRLRVEVEVFYECIALQVTLHEAPQLLLSIPQFEEANVTPGVHAYETELEGMSALVPHGEDWVGCLVYADLGPGHRQVALPEMVVHVRELEGYEEGNVWLRLAVVPLTIAVIMVTFAIALWRRRARGRADGARKLT